MKVPKIESTYEPLPAATYVARLYSIIQIGSETYEYQGKSITQNKVSLTFEFPTELREFGEGEKPYVLSKEFTFSMHAKSKLRPFIESWLGDFKNDDDAYDLDFSDLIGKTGLVSVSHYTKKSGAVGEKISAIVPLPKGMTCPDPVNTPILLSYDNWDKAAFESLSDYMQERMKKTPEYRSMFEEVDIEEIEVN